MALYQHKQIHSQGEIGIWQITENEAFFIEQMSLYPEEAKQLAAIKGRKRLEWLASRYLVHIMSGRKKRAPFLKDEFGKPHLLGSKHHVSISHSKDMTAAIASPYSVGIDIQYLIGKIGRIAHKFTRSEERAIMQPETQLEHLHVYWGAKEALYKAYGRKKLDFCQHILIDPFEFNPSHGICRGHIQKGQFQASFQLKYELVNQYMLVYAIQENHPQMSNNTLST